MVGEGIIKLCVAPVSRIFVYTVGPLDVYLVRCSIYSYICKTKAKGSMNDLNVIVDLWIECSGRGMDGSLPPLVTQAP